MYRHEVLPLLGEGTELSHQFARARGRREDLFKRLCGCSTVAGNLRKARASDNRGKRVVKGVGDAPHEVPEGAEALRLEKVILDAAPVGDVFQGDDRTVRTSAHCTLFELVSWHGGHLEKSKRTTLAELQFGDSGALYEGLLHHLHDVDRQFRGQSDGVDLFTDDFGVLNATELSKAAIDEGNRAVTIQ